MSQKNGQPSSSAMVDQQACPTLCRWISSSWEMCPHFCWNGAAQEYINQINRILDGASRPGSTSHSREPSNWGSRSPSTHQASQPVTLPPPKSTPVQQAPAATTQPLGLSPTLAAPSPIPSTSPIIPASSGRSRKRAAQGDHPDDPNARAGSKTGISSGTAPATSTSVPKYKPIAPFQLPKPSTADEPSAPGPAPPLFSTFASSKPATASAPPARAFGSFSTTAAFDTSSSPPPRTTPVFGDTESASAAAASQPSMGPSFSFKPATGTTTASGVAAEPKSPSFPLFSGISSTSAASSAAAGGFSTGFSFGKPAAAPGGGASSAAATAASNAAPLFSFGKPADSAAAPVSASFSFAAVPAGMGGSDGGSGTPTFTFGGAAAPAAPAAAPSAAPSAGAAAEGDGDEEAQEKPTKIEIKGDDKTDITFAGKTAFRTKGASGWGDPVSGLLTLRRDKASGRCWMQVNSETKGSIFVYASIAPEAKFRVTAGKPMVNLVVNVFRYPPGQEPHKMADDGSGGKKQLPEKEDNPASAKSVMIRVKNEDLPSFVDALKEIGCQKVE